MAIYQKRGSWIVDYRINGKRYRERVGTSYKLAKEVEHKRKAEIAEGRYFPERSANGQRFRDFVPKFWDLHGQRLRSKQWGYKAGNEWHGMIALWLRDFGDKRLSEIKTADIQAAYNRIASAHKSSTANRYYTLLRLMFNKAEEWGDFYGINPCKKVRRDKESIGRTRYLSQQEIATFARCCHPRLLPIVLCALTTGMRWGEIFGLDWRDVDFVAGILTIRITKSGQSRAIPLPGRLRGLLLTLDTKASGPLFDLPRVMFYRYFDKARKESGLESFRFHDLRHTFASHFVMATRDLRTLQAILGHATPTMTMRYAHLDSEHVAAKMAAVEAVVPMFALPGPSVSVAEATPALPTA